MENLILKSRLLSKWAVLFIDMLIVGWSFCVTYFMIKPLGFYHVSYEHFFSYLVIYSLLSFTVYFLMGIHTGIIRYSNTIDIYKIFTSLLITTILFGFSIVFIIVPFYHLTPIFQTVLFINFSISCTCMIMVRIGVRGIFNLIQRKHSKPKENCLIYGSDKTSILIKQALENCGNNRFCVAGFIDENPNRVSKYIEQKRVFNARYLHEINRKFNIDKLLIGSDDLRSEKARELVEQCIEDNIKVVTLSSTAEWLDGQININHFKALQIEDLLQREPISIQPHNVLEQLSGKVILVTGAAGSIGAEIVRQIATFYPRRIILCDQAESPLHELQLELERSFPSLNPHIFIGNVQNEIRMRQLFDFERPQIVFHAAAYKHVPMMENHPAEAVLTNVLGTKLVADLSVEFEVEKFIMISTDKAVNPTNVMGASKRIAELYIQCLSKKGFLTKFITTRFGNVLGSNGSVIPRFRAQIEKGGPVTVTHPEITRYFMTIPEAVQLVLEAGAMGNGSEIFIFDMGQPVKITDLAKKMIALSGYIPDKDIKIIYTGLRPGEKLYEELLNKDEQNIPTHHSKIKISISSNIYPYNFSELIQELTTSAKINNNFRIVRNMKQIVPEFISNNSQYETLDYENSDIVSM